MLESSAHVYNTLYALYDYGERISPSGALLAAEGRTKNLMTIAPDSVLKILAMGEEIRLTI